MKGAHATQESCLLQEKHNVITPASAALAPGIVAAISPRADLRNLPLSPALLSQHLTTAFSEPTVCLPAVVD
jgi:hypothetical protein